MQIKNRWIGCLLMCWLLMALSGMAKAQTVLVNQDAGGTTAAADLSTYTPPVGGAWVPISTAAQKLTGSGYIYATAAGGYKSSATYNGSTAWTYTGTIHVVTYPTNEQTSLAVYDSSGNYYRFGFYTGSSGAGWYFQGISSTNAQTLIVGPSSAVSYVAGSNYAVNMQRSSAGVWNITVAKDGGSAVSIVTNVTNTLYTPTLAGDFFNAPQTSSTGAWLTNLVFTVAGSALASGTLSSTSVGTTSVTVTYSGASGGTSPYTYQLKRSAHAANTYSNVGTTLTGQTGSATLTDTAASVATSYDYEVVTTDSAATTVTSNILNITTAGHSSGTWYVSASGNGSGSGTTSGTPFTLSQANATVWVPNDIILFDKANPVSGTLTLAQNGTAGSPITLDSYGTGSANISAGNGKGLYLNNVSYITVQNLVINGGGVVASTGLMSDASTNRLPLVDIVNTTSSVITHITLKNLTVTNGYAGIFIHSNAALPGAIDTVDINGCTVHDCLYFGMWSSGSEQAGQTSGSPHYLSKGTVHTNWHVHDSRVYNIFGGKGASYATGFDGGVNTAGLVDTSDNARTLNGTGVLVGNVYGMIVERCEFYNNGQNNSCTLGGPVGIWSYSCNSLIYQCCESHHNHRAYIVDGGGFDFDGETINSICQYCYSHDNDGSGYQTGAFPGSGAVVNCTFRYNISANDALFVAGGAFLHFGATTNTQVYNNTFYLGSGANASAYCLNDIVSGCTYRNNLCLAQSGRLHTGTSTLANNLWWNYAGATTIPSADATGIGVNPQLLNPTATTTAISNLVNMNSLLTLFTPTNTSPGTNAGLNLLLQSLYPGNRDFVGNYNLAGNNYDIGAIQYSAVAQQSTTGAALRPINGGPVHK